MKISFKFVLIVSITILLGFYLYTRGAQGGLPPVAETSNGSIINGNVVRGVPVRLIIPSINVDASIEKEGLTAAGAMDAPKSPSNAGWFKLGPEPGQEGSAVIDGHSGWKNGIPAVFDKLSQLKKGDKVYVADARGSTVVFVVREIRSYDESASATSVFSSRDGKSHLNLITCEGVWNRITKSYSSRLVAFADKEES